MTPAPERQRWQVVGEIVEAARANLPAVVWDYGCGGADSETTLRRNRSAFDHIAFRPRVLRPVSDRDTATTFLGIPLALPVMLAPVGSVAQFHPAGALACAQAAQRAGTAACVGLLSSPSLEEVRAASGGPLLLQLYVRGDHEWLLALMRRAEQAGYAALCLTVDSAAYGRRERDLYNRFFPAALDARPNIPDVARDADAALRERFQASLSWDDVDWMREHTRLPLVLKGILSPEDAELAVQHGVAAIYVSNHGGRQLDHAPATIEVLREIVQAVGGRAEVVVDSGFMRGSDVVKALALGARAVLIGKLMLWGLGAGGAGGVARALEILRDEISTIMANIGVRSLAELGPEYLRPSLPPAPEPAASPQRGSRGLPPDRPAGGSVQG